MKEENIQQQFQAEGISTDMTEKSIEVARMIFDIKTAKTFTQLQKAVYMLAQKVQLKTEQEETKENHE